MINRLLTDLVKGGYIDVSGHGIVLLKKLPPKWQGQPRRASSARYHAKQPEPGGC